MKKAGRIFKLIGKIILLLLIAAMIVLPAFFINTLFGYFTIMFAVLAVVFSFVILQIMGRFIEVNGESSEAVCARGEKIDIALKVKNRSVFIAPKTAAVVVIPDIRGNADSMQEIPFAIGRHADVEFALKLSMNHVGVYEVGIDGLWIYDFFGIFRKYIPLGGSVSTVVIPKSKERCDVPQLHEVMAESARETKNAVVGGTDYTGVRGYEPGDPMKQIHWKLSAHSRDYLTKIQESHRQQELAIILDMASEKPSDSDELMDINDALIETAIGVCEDISKTSMEIQNYLIYRAKNGVLKKEWNALKNTAELVRNLSVINPEPDSEYPDACAILRAESEAASRTSNIVVVTSRITDDLINELMTVKRQSRSPELYYIASASKTDKDIEGVRAKMKVLDSLSVPYHIVTCDYLHVNVSRQEDAA